VTLTPTAMMIETALDNDGDVVTSTMQFTCSSAVPTAVDGPASGRHTSSTVSQRHSPAQINALVQIWLYKLAKRSKTLSSYAV